MNNTTAGAPAPRDVRRTSLAPHYDFEDTSEGPRATPDIVTIKVADIATRGDWQVRDGINVALVRDYATHYVYGEPMPPLRLAKVNGVLVLMDGWHRLFAQKRLDRETVEATVEELSEDEAQWEAAMANTRNGARLSRQSEKRKVFALYMKQGRNRKGKRGLKSYREIAKDIGGLLSKSGVEKAMKKDFPKIAAKMSAGRDAGAGVDPAKAHKTAEEYVRECIAQAAAEARGVHCLGKRRRLVQEFARALLEPTGGTSEAIEINNDF